MDAAFAQLMMKIGVNEEFKNFLTDQGIMTGDALGRLCSTEAEVKAELINPAIAAGVKFEKLVAKSAVVGLWSACREAMKEKKESEDDNVNQDAPIPKVPSDNIIKLWDDKHGFVLPEDWLLTPILQGKLWRGFIAQPPRLEILLAESLRTLACKDKPTGTQLAVVPGRAVETQAVIADLVTKPMELYIRIRAFFYTAAYVSIATPLFFDYQTAIFMSEKVMHFVTQTFNGQLAPVHFYVKSWAATIHHLAETVRISSTTLKDACRQTAAWEHRWSGWTPPNNVVNNNGINNNNINNGGAVGNADLPKHVTDEINRNRESAKKWQADAQRLQHEVNVLRNTGGNFGNNGKNGKKGGNKGKNGGKRSREEDRRDERDSRGNGNRDHNRR